MAKTKDSAHVEAMTEIRDASTGKLVNDFQPPVEKATVAGKDHLTFEMYCVQRQIPVQNRAGMRAFTQKGSATLAEWDAIFKRY